MPELGRDELYERVWTEPVRTLAQGFGLSDVGLKKICARANIPAPDRGYWTKVRKARAEALRRVREAQIAPEKARREQLLSMARDLRSADEVREPVRRAQAARSADPDRAAIARGSAWALGVADRLDPVARLVIDATGQSTLSEPDWPTPANGADLTDPSAAEMSFADDEPAHANEPL